MNRKQNDNAGIRHDIVLVNEEDQLFSPDRDVFRKTEIIDTGIRSPSRKKPVIPDRDDDGY
jgi:hypothetical protein